MRFDSLEAYHQSAQFLRVNQHNIAYWHHHCDVNAPWILFIHGFPSASWDWHEQWQALSAEYNLLAFDMLGFGVSDKPQAYPYCLLEQADIAIELINSMPCKALHMVCHDYGVSVGQELLRRHEDASLPFTISSLLFLNGGLFAEVHRPLLTQKLLASSLGPLLVKCLGKSGLQRSFNKIFATSTPPSSQTIDMLWQLLGYKDGKACLPYLLRYIQQRKVHRDAWIHAMQNTQVPLGFVNGVHDPISGQHMLDLFRDLLPNSYSSALAVGHYPQIEAASEVNKCMRQFIAWSVNEHFV